LPNFFFEHAWPGMLLWSLLYISDYTFTIVCARLYARQDKVVFEGSYEITPYYQKDINALRIVSPRFVFILLLTLGALGFVWILNRSSPAPELWEFLLGALIGLQLMVHMRHFRNLFQFRALNNTDSIRGHLEYSRPVLLRGSSWECFGASGFYLMLFAFTGSWFILGGALTCFSTGIKHRKLASKYRVPAVEALQKTL
jgi:hypothetical protein